MATKQVNIDIIAKDKTTKAMNSATKGVNRLKDNVQQSVATQQKSFNALGNTIRNVVGGVIVFQTLRFSKQMVDMASSVEEMRSKSSVVFGQFVTDVRKQLESFGNEVGRSTFELEKMASSIQDTFVPMGFARGEASKLSVQLTKLAVDVASFNNASDVDTMMAFQSALVGNHETVRRFGVVITEATLKQELLRMGINKNAKDVTNAEKVQARLNLIIAGTSDAHNDATKTSGSFANTSKALGSALNELSVDVITPMLPKLTKMVEGFIGATDSARNFFVAIGMLNRDLSTSALRQERIAEIEDKLIEIRGGLLTKVFGLNKVEKIHIQNLEAELGHLQKMPELMAMVSDAEVIATKTIENENKARKAKNKILAEEIKLKNIGLEAFPTARPDIIGFQQPTGAELGLGNQIDASMTGSELLEAEANKMTQLQQMADMEVEIAQITADKTLKIAEETAQKEKQIREKFISENLGLMREGKFNELKLESMSAEQRADLTKASLKDTLGELAKHNKTAFALNKAFNIAQAIQNTATGISKALAMGPIGIPLAIAIGAMGAVQIATIASSKYQGRRLGGRMNQDQPYMVGEAGPELVVPDRASNVVPNNQLGGMGKAVTVNFNISTVDARGFNELLVNSRGTIVNLINSAVNEKGKMAIV